MKCVWLPESIDYKLVEQDFELTRAKMGRSGVFRFLSKVKGCGGLGGSQLTTSDKEVTKQDLVLKGGDRGACKLLGDVMVMLERW
ncbi:hypothetical protein Tco_0889813 [Tanacetum coccineum]